MFWIGFSFILVAAIVLTEIIIFVIKPFVSMVAYQKKKIVISNELSETDYTLEIVTQPSEEESEYYDVPVLVSSYTVDLSGVKDQIQKIEADEIEILEFEDDVSVNPSEEII